MFRAETKLQSAQIGTYSSKRLTWFTHKFDLCIHDLHEVDEEIKNGHMPTCTWICTWSYEKWNSSCHISQKFKKIVIDPLKMNTWNSYGHILKLSLNYDQRQNFWEKVRPKSHRYQRWKMRKDDKAKAWNTKQNCRINGLVSSQSKINMNVSCDA
jgi:hypothetical protein